MGTGQAIMPAIKSIQQGSRLKNLPDVERPDFQIPKAAEEQLGLARTLTSNRNMPGYDEALDKIENQTNRTIGDVKAAGGNMQDIMAAMAAANVGAGMAKRDLDITNAKSYLGSLQNLQGQLGTYANWQNAQQQDQMKAYNDEMARRAALDTARQQNMQNAVGSVGQGVATGLGYQMNMNLMNKMYPGATPPVTPPVTPPGEVKGIDISTLPNPTATVDIQPQLQNRGPIAGQQPDVQDIVSSLQGLGVIPGTPTAPTAPPAPPVNQIQGSLQGQMGSDFASTSGMNAPTSGAVMPVVPASVPTINQPEPAPAPAYRNPSTGLTGQEQQSISSLISAGIIPGTNASNVNVGELQSSLAANNQVMPDYASSLNSNPSGAMPEMTSSQKSEAQLTKSLNSNPPGTITSIGGAGFYFMDSNGKMYGGADEAEVMKLRDKMMPTYKK
jgi:hypothetical protein